MVAQWNPSLWPRGIGAPFQTEQVASSSPVVSDTYFIFTEPAITRVSSRFSGYIWRHTKIVLKNKYTFKEEDFGGLNDDSKN